MVIPQNVPLFLLMYPNLRFLDKWNFFMRQRKVFFWTPDTQEGFHEDLLTSISYLAIMDKHHVMISLASISYLAVMDKHHATMNAKVIK